MSVINMGLMPEGINSKRNNLPSRSDSFFFSLCYKLEVHLLAQDISLSCETELTNDICYLNVTFSFYNPETDLQTCG